jgi:prevent-host-death family protein
MSAKVSVQQLQARLQEVLEQAVRTGEECVVQREGKDYAVIVSAREWRRRTLGRRLDALGPTFRLSPEKQARAEQLLARSQRGTISPAERRELDRLLRECDRILERRAAALDRLS